MAEIKAESLGYQVPHAGTWGNVATATAAITRAAATNGDEFVFLRLPAHTRLLDLTVVNSASSASTTMKFGYKDEDGNGDDDYFMAAKSLATAAKHRADAANPPLVVEKPFSIVGTLGGANIATGTTITVTATYEYQNR
jgi:hypothetical protein